MSGHQAIAAVTSALQRILQTAISLDGDVGSGQVTSRAPDKARTGAAINQVNLFLYRTAIAAAWRNADPTQARRGETGLPPLPLVLSYVLTAYGEDDDEILAHRLLGIAMGVLNDTPLLSREVLAAALPGSGLEAQTERVRITPGPIPQDEISHMWATFQTGYRISTTYDVAVVLIDSTRPITAPLPVLTRGADDRGPQVLGILPPLLETISPVPLRPDPAQGMATELMLAGHRLSETTTLVVNGARLDQPVTIVPDTVTEHEIRAHVPANALPAGTYGVITTTGQNPDLPSLTSAELPFALAPVIVEASPVALALNPNGPTNLTLTCAPAMAKDQAVALVVGDTPIPGQVDAGQRDRVTFTLIDLPPGTYRIRLRVDRQDSLTTTAGRPSFHLLELT